MDVELTTSSNHAMSPWSTETSEASAGPLGSGSEDFVGIKKRYDVATECHPNYNLPRMHFNTFQTALTHSSIRYQAIPKG